MAQQELRFCPKCKEEHYCEWQCDRDSNPEEPQFFLICCSCGYEFDPESPVNQDLTKLPKDQTKLFS